MPYSTYTNSMPTFNSNMYQYTRNTPNLYRRPYQTTGGDRLIGGGFALPFALGFLSGPLFINSGPRPRPVYYRPPYYQYPNYYPYY